MAAEAERWHSARTSQALLLEGTPAGTKGTKEAVANPQCAHNLRSECLNLKNIFAFLTFTFAFEFFVDT